MPFSAKLIGRGNALGSPASAWSGEAWMPHRLSVRAALVVYVLAAIIGWAGIVGLAYGVRALLDEVRASLSHSSAISDTRPLDS